MSSPRLRFHAAARREFLRTGDHYDEEADGLGTDFINEVQDALRTLAEFPEAGHPHLAGTRRLVIRRFPFSLVYWIRSDEIAIVALPHHRRTPGYWLRRQM